MDVIELTSQYKCDDDLTNMNRSILGTLTCFVLEQSKPGKLTGLITTFGLSLSCMNE